MLRQPEPSPTLSGRKIHQCKIHTASAHHRQNRREFTALLDTGSEISLINPETTRYAQEIGNEVTSVESQIHLASDRALANINGKITLSLITHQKNLEHAFQILLILDSPILGIDL
ncbi:hypothetical protein P5V15_010238 [Pogonomyrmex californicus]